MTLYEFLEMPLGESNQLKLVDANEYYNGDEKKGTLLDETDYLYTYNLCEGIKNLLEDYEITDIEPIIKDNHIWYIQVDLDGIDEDTYEEIENIKKEHEEESED